MTKKKNSGIKLSFILAAIAAVLGVWGYHTYESLSWWDSIYYTLKLFSLSVLGDEHGLHWMVQIARLLAPFSLCTAAMSLLSKKMDTTVNWFKSWSPNSVAVYGTNEIANLTAEQNHWIRANDSFLGPGKKHVILMDTDDDNFRLLKEHEKRLSKKDVYIGLQEMPPYLLRKNENQNVFFFNIYEEIARDYWKKYSLHKDTSSSDTYRIVLLGYRREGLGYHLLKQGILNNVFPDDRTVTYDVIGEEESLYIGFENLNLMNNDTLTWHSAPWYSCAHILRRADRIILTEDVTPSFLNQLFSICTNQQIDYYTPQSLSYPQEYKYEPLHPFGVTESILNEETLLKGGLIKDAKMLNYRYVSQYGSAEDQEKAANARTEKEQQQLADVFWSKLDGFTKSSNIAWADYHLNHKCNASGESETDVEKLARAEHIRWCRFHFLSGWQYGESVDGKRKNSTLRIHRDLLPWNELPETEREKNRHQVKMDY